MKKIQEKYKDNPQEMQMKMAALYKDAGVNPLAGCLPLLIQIQRVTAEQVVVRCIGYRRRKNISAVQLVCVLAYRFACCR